MTRLKVAAIQPENRNDDVSGNLERAEYLVERAAQDGANLVLCPELLAAGYRFDFHLWRHGEPMHGPSVTWLKRLAHKHSIYIGASFLEKSGQDHYNTFVLVDRRAEVIGTVRKSYLPFFEPFVCRPSNNSHIIDTEIGRLGVGICFENQLRSLLKEFEQHAVDLVLMPHSHPYLKSSGFLGRALLRAINEIGDVYSRTLEVPVIIANKAGKVHSQNPLIPMQRFQLPFTGGSAIYGHSGKSVLKLGFEPDYLVKEIEINLPQAKPPITVAADPLSYSDSTDWVLSQSWTERAGLPVLKSLEWMGRRSYEKKLKTKSEVTYESSVSD